MFKPEVLVVITSKPSFYCQRIISIENLQLIIVSSSINLNVSPKPLLLLSWCLFFLSRHLNLRFFVIRMEEVVELRNKAESKKKTTATKWVWYINRTDWIPLHDNFGGNVVLKRTKRFVCAVPRKLICQNFLPAHTRHTTQTKIFSNNDYAERKNHHALLRLVRR